MRQKRWITRMVLFAAITCISLSSCVNKKGNNVGALQFDSIQINRTEHLLGDTANPACNLTLNLTYATQSQSETLKDSLNCYILSTALGENYATLSADQAVKEYSNRYIQRYRQDLDSLYSVDKQENGKNAGAWYSYYKGVDGHVQLYKGTLLTYRINYNEYTGGAHGIYMTTYLNLDLNTLTPIRLDDLFADNYQEALTDLLWNQLMMENQAKSIQELEDMGYTTTGELTPTENFFLTSEGITFHYNVYEIAPYAMGAIQITIPYEMMSHLLDDQQHLIDNLK